MARPTKTGLNYFPLDVDFFDDPRVGAVTVEHGTEGQAAVVMLLCAIYRNGYYIEWTQENDVYGCRLTSKTNGKTLFLPAAGRRAGSELLAAGKGGGYWSSSLYEDPNYAWYFDIYSANQFMFCSYRYVGRSVRPVCSAR